MNIVINLGQLTEKQKLFCKSRTLFTAYGGARGGGKTHAVRWKAVAGALRYGGLRILIIRRTYPELQQNHIEPIIRLVPPPAGHYNITLRSMSFYNGSVIKFGHYSGSGSEAEYQGRSTTGYSSTRPRSSPSGNSVFWEASCAASTASRNAST